jgi:hypothetical protein
MPTTEFQILGAFETHSVDEIRALLDAGLDVHAPIKGKSVVNSLTEMYSRSDAFPDCLRLLLDRGAVLDDLLRRHRHLLRADGLDAAGPPA